PGAFIKCDKYSVFKSGQVSKGAEFRVTLGGTSVVAPSQSEADLAFATVLALYHDGDVEKMDDDFRASALYREKSERKDYRKNKIEKELKAAEGIKGSQPMDLTDATPVPPPTPTAAPSEAPSKIPASVILEQDDVIPPFDDLVITGVFREIVDLAAGGT